MIRKSVIAIWLSVFFSPLAVATPIVFDLRSSLIESIDEQTSIELTNDGILAILTANTGVLNVTSSSFGVNASASGDATSLIDNGSGITESIQIQFNLAVKFLGLNVSSFGSTDTGLLSLNNTPILEISSSGLNSTHDIFVNSSDVLTLAFVSGNGFSFDSFSVDATSVSEPESMLLFLLSGLIFSLGHGQKIRKRRFYAKTFSG